MTGIDFSARCTACPVSSRNSDTFSVDGMLDTTVKYKDSSLAQLLRISVPRKLHPEERWTIRSEEMP